MNNLGYHTDIINKGVYGESSKILEEILELIDAEKQGCIVMQLVECADLYGALEAYIQRKGLTMDDLRVFSDITKRAFINGYRT